MSTSRPTDQNSPEYRAAVEDYGICDECQVVLWPEMHIFVMTNEITKLEETVCEHCRNDFEWSEGWYDDEED